MAFAIFLAIIGVCCYLVVKSPDLPSANLSPDKEEDEPDLATKKMWQEPGDMDMF